MSDDDTADAPTTNPAGKVVVFGLLLLILGGVGGIGYMHATRNTVRHEAGLGGDALYAMYCARCHGDHLEPGRSRGLRPRRGTDQRDS